MSRLFIAGHRGFLGRQLMAHFPEARRVDGYDYTVYANCLNVISDIKPDVLINCAGKVGGILANKTYPADFFYENLLIGSNLMEAARQSGVKKYIQIGTVCSYPRTCSLPMKEADFWNGEPEVTNGAYGQAKRALVAQAQAYAAQYGFNVLCPILANLYGPGDHYEAERSHVIPAMIRKFSEAVETGQSEVILWGTGQCSREFLYVKDAAEAVKFMVDSFNTPELVNIASGKEIQIKFLAKMIAGLCEYKGRITWDTSKPDGQPRRCFDTSKLAALGWTAKTGLEEGLFESIKDYKSARIKA